MKNIIVLIICLLLSSCSDSVGQNQSKGFNNSNSARKILPPTFNINHNSKTFHSNSLQIKLIELPEKPYFTSEFLGVLPGLYGPETVHRLENYSYTMVTTYQQRKNKDIKEYKYSVRLYDATQGVSNSYLLIDSLCETNSNTVNIKFPQNSSKEYLLEYILYDSTDAEGDCGPVRILFLKENILCIICS